MPRKIQRLLSAGLTATLIVGCGSAGSQATPIAPASLANPIGREGVRRGTGSPRIVYLAAINTSGSGYIVGYAEGQLHQMVCIMPASVVNVNSIGVDQKGTLWLPAQDSPPAVYSFGPDCGSPGITLTAPQYANPTGIAFGNDGTNYVIMGGNYPYSRIYAYPEGQTKWTRTLSDPSAGRCCTGIGADKRGNVFGGLQENPGVIVEFKHGRGKGIKLKLKGIGETGGSIMFDRDNNMIVPDNTNNVIDVFSPPYSGSPRKIKLIHELGGQCALNRRETVLGCASTGSTITSETDFYSYPRGKYEFDIPGIPAHFVSFDPSARY